MAVRDLYSRRLANLQKTPNDVFNYEQIPPKVRVQIVHVWHEVIGLGFQLHGSPYVWELMLGIMRKELGVFFLNRVEFEEPKEELTNFFLRCPIDDALDALELVCQTMEMECRQNWYCRRQHPSAIVDEGLKEINDRLCAAAIGYTYTNGQLIRIDSTFIHGQAVLPALDALQLQPLYAGAESEFLKAHAHYRKGEAAPVLIECCKAFESIMKAICHKRGWTCQPTDTARALVEVCMANSLIPPFWQTHFNGLRSVLESALPTPRNKLSGHGAGVAPTVVPLELARYVLHMTAATLLFLAEAEAALP